MKVRIINFDEDEQPTDLTVRMSLDEAMAIADLAGKVPGPSPVVSEIYDALVGSFFNRYWHNGINGVKEDEE